MLVHDLLFLVLNYAFDDILEDDVRLLKLSIFIGKKILKDFKVLWAWTLLRNFPKVVLHYFDEKWQGGGQIKVIVIYDLLDTVSEGGPYPRLSIKQAVFDHALRIAFEVVE